MKFKTIFFVFSLFSICVVGQDKFELKAPNLKHLKEINAKNEMGIDVIHLYFENNYSNGSKKYAIQKDPDFDNTECGFTQKYQFGIEFVTNNCGEASPLTQTITLPKMNLKSLKKWVEQIYTASLIEDMEPVNKWHKSKNEFTPGDEEAGCYYTIKQTTTNSVIEVWCGC